VTFFNDRIFHFQKSIIKLKLKIGSNEFLIWVSWHSCMLKRNNVPWLPWFQMEEKKKKNSSILWHNLTFDTLVATLTVFWPLCTISWLPTWINSLDGLVLCVFTLQFSVLLSFVKHFVIPYSNFVTNILTTFFVYMYKNLILSLHLCLIICVTLNP
jgi:hypothetical protein